MTAAPRITRHGYGAISALAKHLKRTPRVVMEGPANTGKTSSLLWWLEVAHAWNHPGIRVLLLRQTMQSLRESILATLEDKVWAPMTGGKRHPAQHGTAKRENRKTYQYPNGTTFVLGGLEDPGWTYSMEYDIILAFEAWQISRDAVERLGRANRNHVLCRYAEWNKGLAELVGGDWLDDRWMRWHGQSDPAMLAAAPADVRGALRNGEPFGCWQQLILDTNPSGRFHWINQAAPPLEGGDLDAIKEGRDPSRRIISAPGYMLTRVLSRHCDNPACTPDDLARLSAMTGSRRANLYLGLWETAEGQIWPTFDPTVHMVSATIERIGERNPGHHVDERPMLLRFRGEHPHLSGTLEVKWAFASMDFGYQNATVLQVWLATYDDRIFRAVEIYRRNMIDDWFAERLVELYCEFNLYAVVADCADPNRIVKLNDRLEGFRGRKGSRIVQGVDKSLKRGSRTNFVPTKLDLVRDMLEPTQPGGPRMYWLHDGMREYPCPISADKLKPTSSTEEIPGYSFKQHEDGKPDLEEPDKACAQDGCDATAYAAVFFWLMDPVGPKSEPAIRPGSAAARMGHGLVRKVDRL